MMPATTVTLDHPEWDAFSSRHSGSPFLTHDPLYALSEDLIDSIKHCIPNFFTPTEELFERDLVRTASFGFFLGAALGRTQQTTTDGSEQTLAERQETTAEQINDLLAEELRRIGADPEDVGEHFAQHSDQRTAIVSRQAAYTGWLVLNPEYRAELKRFREQWEHAVQQTGRFPGLRMWLLSDPTDGGTLPTGFREACYEFFSRWSLDTLLTWDWPVTMEPDLNVGLREGSADHSSGGVTVFLPWHLLRGERFDLQVAIRLVRLATAPDHLRPWVTKQGHRKGHDFDDARYAMLGWFYRYHELVLKRRYPKACRGNQLRLDRAFAAVLNRDEDTVKKLRLEIQRSAERSGSESPSGE